MKTWMFLALCLTLWFVLLEVIELSQSGFASYFTNLWNVMDWANFILFFQVYRILDAQISLQERDRLRMDFGAQGADLAAQRAQLREVRDQLDALRASNSSTTVAAAP